MVEALIVGLDPGITIGMAILGSDGKLLDIWSKRDASNGDVIKHIVKFGQPVIIATDVKQPPRKVKAIARKFGCKTYSPSKALPIMEKNRLAKLYATKIGDSHELDALAAASKAFHMYQEFFNRVATALKKRNMQHFFKEVVELLLSDESENITNAINKLQNKNKK